MKTKVIFNPISGSGKSIKFLKPLQQALEKEMIAEISFSETTQTRTAKELTSEALSQGYQWIIGIGGDGTLSQVTNGFFQKGLPINSDAIFTPIPAGRGNDFVKTVKVSTNPDLAIPKIIQAPVQNMDLIRIQCKDDSNNDTLHFCLNLTDFGMGGEVVYKVNQSQMGKWVGGKAIFLFYTLLGLFTYKNQKIQIVLDNNETIEQKSRLVVCANGEYAGGGMWFAPQAKLSDGFMDVLVFNDSNAFQTLQKFGLLYKGKLSSAKEVIVRKAQYLFADSEAEVFIDCDGENIGKLPASFEIIPSILKIKC